VKEWVTADWIGAEMASLQALCSICEKKVTAFTLLGDNDLEPLLDRNQEIIVRHVFGDESGKQLDHRWSLLGKEKEDLAKLIRLMAQEKKRLGHRA
jgi:hypothetical protein